MRENDNGTEIQITHLIDGPCVSTNKSQSSDVENVDGEMK